MYKYDFDSLSVILPCEPYFILCHAGFAAV